MNKTADVTKNMNENQASKEDYYVVAKMIDGKARWGVLDHTGTEVIPCQYTAIQDTRYDVVIFQEEEKGLYGLMYIDGTIIVKPKFYSVNDLAAVGLSTFTVVVLQ